MPSYDNPVPQLKIRKKAVVFMTILSSIGMGILILLTQFFFSHTLIPLMVSFIFYVFSMLYIWVFYKNMKSRTPQKIWLENRSFWWRDDGTKHEVSYDQVMKVERVNDELYIIYLSEDGSKKLYSNWPIAEEIEERAGLYPYGKR